MVLSRLADHVGSDLDPMAVPQIEHARNAFPIAIGEPGVGGRVGWHVGREIHLGERAVGALRRLPASLELHRNRNHHLDPVGPEGRRGAFPRLGLARLSPPAPRGGRGLYGRRRIQHHPGGQDAGAGASLPEKVSPIRTGQIGAIIGERDCALHCGSPHFATRSSCCIKVTLSSMCQLSAMRPLAMR